MRLTRLFMMCALLLAFTLGVNAQEKKSWDFTQGLSVETIDNLNADATNWTANGQDAEGNTNNWKNARNQGVVELTANGEVIPELKGLTFDIGKNKDNSIHLATTKLRLTRKSTKITFPKLTNGQKITIVGRSANGTATNRGIAPVQSYLQFQAEESSPQTNGACLFLGQQVEGSEGTYTFVWKVVTDSPDSVDVQFQLTPDAGIDFTLFMIDEGDAEIPAPELAISKLNIVDELTIDVEQKPRAGYDADKVEISLTEALGKLGITDLSVVKEQLNELLFATDSYLPDDVVFGVQVLDSLTNEPTAGGIGFWMHAVCDAEGTETSQCARYAYDGQDKFYMESFAFDPETGMLTCNLGQYPNNLKGGQTYYTNIYIVYGDKAIKIRYNLNIEDVQLGALEDYEKAGESTIEVEMEPQDNYNTKDFSIDIEAITAALGAAPDDFYILQDNSFADKNQEGVGYWVDNAGGVIGWGTNAMFYVTPKAEDFSKFGIGQYPGHMNVNDAVTAVLYFLANGKYYQLNINLKIIAPKTVDAEFTVVATRPVNVQQVPGEYVWTSGTKIPAEWVELQLGTSEWVLYALDKLNEDGSEMEGNAKYSKKYTCIPYPGFWMDGGGHNVGWNANARVGVTIAEPEGKFSLMQYPGVKLGDVFKFPLFFVNEDNGKMVQFDFTYKIVETVEETLPEPELAWENLDIVGEVEINVEQKSCSWYNADKVEVNISDVLRGMGISNFQMVQNELRQMLYVSNAMVTDSIAMTIEKSAVLSNDSTALGIGFWLRAIENDEYNESVECVSYPFGLGNHFFVEHFAFNAETGILSCDMGQFPDGLKGGKTYYAYLYLVYGTKAIRLRYNLSVTYLGTLADYELVGDSSVTIEMELQDNYETADIAIDIESICGALGCSVGEIDDFYMLDEEGGFAGKNEKEGGYWLDKDGKVMKWDPFVGEWEGGRGIDAMFFITPKASDCSVLGIGHYPDHLRVGDTYHANLYFLANGMYYQLGVDLKIVGGGKIGDVNNDGTIDVTDAVLIIDEILMKNPQNFDAAMADVNGDGEIDVTDVVMVIDAILGKITLVRGVEASQKDLSAYTAFQMDLTIPAGYVLEGVELTEIAKMSHSLAYNMLADGRCRIVVFSMDNEALPGAWDEVIRLNLRGQGDAFVNVDRAMFVTVGGVRHELLLNGTTSIAQLSTLNSQFSIVYDLQGRKVEKTAKGLYIENGRKVVIK